MKTTRTLFASLFANLPLLFWTPASPAADEKSAFTVAGIQFTAPDTWKKLEATSAMRQAEFSVAGEEGEEAAEVVFFYFGGGQGGSVDANVARWYAQFQEPKDKIEAKTETVEREGKKITFVEAKGTYLSGPPAGRKTPKPGYALLGAILEGEGGPVFVKMTGPAKVVEAAGKQFRDMVLGPVK